MQTTCKLHFFMHNACKNNMRSTCTVPAKDLQNLEVTKYGWKMLNTCKIDAKNIHTYIHTYSCQKTRAHTRPIGRPTADAIAARLTSSKRAPIQRNTQAKAVRTSGSQATTCSHAGLTKRGSKSTKHVQLDNLPGASSSLKLMRGGEYLKQKHLWEQRMTYMHGTCKQQSEEKQHPRHKIKGKATQRPMFQPKCNETHIKRLTSMQRTCSICKAHAQYSTWKVPAKYMQNGSTIAAVLMHKQMHSICKMQAKSIKHN